MSVKNKLGIAVLGLALLIAIDVWGSLFQKASGRRLELAGQERLLSQKLVSEVVALHLRRLQGGDDPALAAAIGNGIQVFSQTLAALKDGGQITLELASGPFPVTCRPAVEPMAGQLGKVDGLWQEYAPQVELFLKNTPEAATSIDWLLANNQPLLQEMDRAVTMLQDQTGKQMRVLCALQLAAVALIFLCLGWAIFRLVAIGRGLEHLAGLAGQLGTEKLSVTAGNGRDDEELAGLGAALDKAAVRWRAMTAAVSQGSGRLTGQTKEFANSADQMMKQTADMSERAQAVLTETETLQESTSSCAARVQDLNTRMAEVALAARDSSEQIGIIIDSTEEMSATIADIAANAEKARHVAGTAVANVNAASSRVDELGAAALEINKVTDVIVEIAEQTKLLALNATIEAARAGEAGKGFAVVANEVKELALQTNNAIAEIRNKVEAMQQSTDNTITEIGAIDQTIKAVNEIVVSIAGAVEEQSVTTKDIVAKLSQGVGAIKRMGTTVNEAAAGFVEVDSQISQVTGTAQGIATGMTTASQRSLELKRTAATINQQMAALLTSGEALQAEVDNL